MSGLTQGSFAGKGWACAVLDGGLISSQMPSGETPASAGIVKTDKAVNRIATR